MNDLDSTDTHAAHHVPLHIATLVIALILLVPAIIFLASTFFKPSSPIALPLPGDTYGLPSIDPDASSTVQSSTEVLPLVQSSDERIYAIKSLGYSKGLDGVVLYRYDSETETWTQDTWIADRGYAGDTGILIGSNLYLINYTEELGGETRTAVLRVDLNALSEDPDRVATFSSDTYLTSIAPFGDSILAYGVTDPNCIDYPRGFGRCIARTYTLSTTDTLIPFHIDFAGAKALMGVNTAGDSLVLEDGYGDAGCVSLTYYIYSSVRGTSTRAYGSGGCEGDAVTPDDVTTNSITFLQSIAAEFPGLGSPRATVISGDGNKWYVPRSDISDPGEYLTEIRIIE